MDSANLSHLQLGPVTARGDGGITTTSTSFPASGAARESWFLGEATPSPAAIISVMGYIFGSYSSNGKRKLETAII